MEPGIDPPEWAANLTDKWIRFRDCNSNRLEPIQAFVLWCDTLGDRVRLWSIDEGKARRETETGQEEPGIFVTFIEEDTTVWMSRLNREFAEALNDTFWGWTPHFRDVMFAFNKLSVTEKMVFIAKFHLTQGNVAKNDLVLEMMGFFENDERA